jgi:hypothetical protein
MQISVDVLVSQTRSASALNIDLASAGSIIGPVVTLASRPYLARKEFKELR